MKKYIGLFILFLLATTGLFAQAEEAKVLGQWSDATLIGSTAHNNTYNEIWGYAINDHEYAIIGSTAGTHFIDVTDPTNPFEAFFVRGRSAGNHIIHRDYDDYEGYLYVVADEGGASFEIIDMNQLPDTISVTYSNTVFQAHNIFVDKENARLYAMGREVETLDISTPNNPVSMSVVRDFADGAFTYFHDGYFENNVAFLNTGNSGLIVADFTDATNPVLINSLSEYAGNGYNHSGWISTDCSTYYFADENHGSDLKVLDVNDLCDLEVGNTFDAQVENVNSIAHNLIVSCDYLYTSYYYDGLRVYDISDQQNPQLVRYYDTYPNVDRTRYEGAWGVYPFLPSGNILVSDMQSGLFVFEGMGDNCASQGRTSNCLQSQSCNFSTPTEDFSVFNEVQISPNPTTGHTSLIVNLSQTLDDLTISLMNVNGQSIDSWQYQNLLSGRNDFSILLPNSLSEGVYFLSLRSEQFHLTKKLIVER